LEKRKSNVGFIMIMKNAWDVKLLIHLKDDEFWSQFPQQFLKFYYCHIINLGKYLLFKVQSLMVSINFSLTYVKYNIKIVGGIGHRFLLNKFPTPVGRLVLQTKSMEGATIGSLSLSEIESTFLNKENNICKDYNDRYQLVP